MNKVSIIKLIIFVITNPHVREMLKTVYGVLKDGKIEKRERVLLANKALTLVYKLVAQEGGPVWR